MSRRAVLVSVAALSALAGIGTLVWVRSPAQRTASTYVPRPAGTLTFNRDIGPIVFRACAPCHRPGEAAPFSLLAYEDVRKRAEQVARVTRSRYMPPWLPQPGYGRFANERRLTDDEIGMIGQWFEEGTARGEPADLPPAPRFTEGWPLGEPDLELALADPYDVPSEGTDVFRNFVLPVSLPATVHVRALDFRPNDPSLVHHANFLVDATWLSRYRDEQDPQPGFDGMHTANAEPPEGHLLGWVPGKTPFGGRDDVAWRLDDGTDLVVQLHMQPSGRRERVSFTVGLYFSRQPPTRWPARVRLGSLTIDVPAGERDYAIEDTYVLPTDVEVLALLPHAHYLAKEMKAWAVLPDGRQEWLLLIEDWNFNWQDEYRYAEPLFLPKGTTLFMRYTYDNTEGNARNPHHPPERVRWGPRTSDEMGDLWIQVLPRTEDDRAALNGDFAFKELQARAAGYEQWIRNDPADVIARIDLGDTLLALGRSDAAIEQLEQALRIDAGHLVARRKLGLALQAGGRRDEAIAQFREVLGQRPDVAEVRCLLANALAAGGRLEEAVSEYREALAIDPALALAHNNLGSALASLGRIDEAVAQYREAIEIDPAYPQAHNNLGQALAVRGRTEEATAHFRRAIEIDPAYATAHVNLGSALAAAGKLDEAIVHFRRAVEIAPDHALARRRLEAALALKEKSAAR